MIIRSTINLITLLMVIAGIVINVSRMIIRGTDTLNVISLIALGIAVVMVVRSECLMRRGK